MGSGRGSAPDPRSPFYPDKRIPDLNRGVNIMTKAMIPPSELWIGLVEMKPLDCKAYGAAGAFTNVLTWACDLEGFRRKAEIIADSLCMYVTEVEGVEPLTERLKRSTITEEVDDMLLRAESNPNAIIYGTFHRYPFDEA
jgi:hypothetical protein